jgi:YHS domain-containing protein
MSDKERAAAGVMAMQLQNVLYFLLWAGLFLVMMRFGCGAHVMGHAHGQHEGDGEDTSADRERLRWVAPETDIDPVCGKTVHTGTAKSAVHGGTVYYFCSNECRERFEAAPQLYVGLKANQEPKQMEHSHG